MVVHLEAVSEGKKEQADKRQDPKTAKGHKWKNNNEH